MDISQTDWEQLPYFLAVARTGSLRRAAATLNTTHLKVNRHLKALEAAWGVELVRRSRSGAALTDAGARLLPTAEQAASLFTQARRSMQGLDRQISGDIRFSVSGPLGQLIAPILARFSRACPQINLVMQVSNALDDQSLARTDVSLRMVHDVYNDAIVRRLFPVALGIYAHRDYIRRTFPEAGAGGQGLTWIGSGDSPGWPEWVAASAFPAANVIHRLDDPLMHLELVASGLGMSRMAAFLAAARPDLVPVPGTALEDGPPLCLITHPELRHTPRVRRFVDFLDSGLKERRDLIRGVGRE